MIITRDFLQKGKSANNGWNKDQWIALGVTEFKKGWCRALIGTHVTEEQAKATIKI